MSADDRAARLALSCVVEPGDLRLASLLARFEPAELWASLRGAGPDGPWRSRARRLDLAAVERRGRACGAVFVVPGDPEWPARLEGLATVSVQQWGGAPLGLWVRGRVPLAAAVGGSVAIVGARAASAYGERVATELAADLAAARLAVVSGAAYGIDAAAHRGSLAAGGVGVAVVAGGLDEAYPRAHAGLLDQLAESGAVVSEVPPGEHPTRRRFLVRNRLIAALSGGTVIVEASLRSGARNTVSWATALGRPVMAVPGPVSSATSVTPHRLIRDGEAVLVTCADDVLELVRPVGEPVPPRQRRARLLDGLDPGRAAIFEALPGRGGRDAGEIALRAGVPLPAALAALAGLADAGLARARPDGTWGVGQVGDRPLPEPGSAEAAPEGSLP